MNNIKKWGIGLLGCMIAFPALAGAAHVSVSGLVTLVLTIIVIGLVFWLLTWLIDYAGLPQPFNKIVKVLLAIVAVLFLINQLLVFFGQSPIFVLG